MATSYTQLLRIFQKYQDILSILDDAMAPLANEKIQSVLVRLNEEHPDWESYDLAQLSKIDYVVEIMPELAMVLVDFLRAFSPAIVRVIEFIREAAQARLEDTATTLKNSQQEESGNDS